MTARSRSMPHATAVALAACTVCAVAGCSWSREPPERQTERALIAAQLVIPEEHLRPSNVTDVMYGPGFTWDVLGSDDGPVVARVTCFRSRLHSYSAYNSDGHLDPGGLGVAAPRPMTQESARETTLELARRLWLQNTHDVTVSVEYVTVSGTQATWVYARFVGKLPPEVPEDVGFVFASELGTCTGFYTYAWPVEAATSNGRQSR